MVAAGAADAEHFGNGVEVDLCRGQRRRSEDRSGQGGNDRRADFSGDGSSPRPKTRITPGLGTRASRPHPARKRRSGSFNRRPDQGPPWFVNR